MRREFPKKVKLERWQHAKECCETCGVKIRAGMGPHYDHSLPDALDGEPTFENCRVLCKTCHGVKTNTEDVPRIAKAYRVLEKRAGLRKSRRGFRKAPKNYDTFNRQWRTNGWQTD